MTFITPECRDSQFGNEISEKIPGADGSPAGRCCDRVHSIKKDGRGSLIIATGPLQAIILSKKSFTIIF